MGVKDCWVSPLRLEVDNAAAAVDQQVLADAHAVHKSCSQHLEPSVNCLLAHGCEHNLFVEFDLVALVAKKGWDVALLVVNDQVAAIVPANFNLVQELTEWKGLSFLANH